MEINSFQWETIDEVKSMLLNEMEIFYYVAEFKSFSKAADKLTVSKSFISKRIAKLEKELRVRLLTRSTRKLILTEAGENFYHHCQHVVEEATKGYSIMGELKGKPTGTLKISLPPALGMNLLAPMLSSFNKKYPDIILDVELENRIVDLISENYDLVLRFAKLEDSNLIVQKILSCKNFLCATPQYLKYHGKPETPDDLEQHNFAMYSHSKNAKQIKFIKNKIQDIVYIQGNFMSNHLDLIKEVVLKNLCMGVFPEFMVSRELNNGRLKICLAEHQIIETHFYAIYPEREFMPLKLKLFLDMLREYLTI